MHRGPASRTDWHGPCTTGGEGARRAPDENEEDEYEEDEYEEGVEYAARTSQGRRR